MKKIALFLAAAAVAAVALVVYAQVPIDPVLVGDGAGGLKQVEVTNFPNPQNVSGVVNVGNLPAVQEVTGTVAVSNLPPMPQPARFQLVGITATQVVGYRGIGVLATTCANEFPGSRMCTSEEILNTNVWPVIPSGRHIARVRPVHVVDGADMSGVFIASRGIRDNYRDQSCGGWVDFSRTSLMVYFDDTETPAWVGQFGVVSCNEMWSVACCAPVP